MDTRGCADLAKGPRDAGYLLGRSPTCRLTGAPLLRVQLLDLRLVLLVDRLALELHRRRQLVAARLPIRREDLELLDLLDAREVLIGAVDPLLHRVDHLLVAGQV